MKQWMIVTVETGIEWPTEETTITFAGRTLMLRPPDGNAAADVRLEYDHPESRRDAFEAISRFLSALSWWRHRPCRTTDSFSCSVPMRGSNGRNRAVLWKDFQLPSAVALHPNPRARLV